METTHHSKTKKEFHRPLEERLGAQFDDLQQRLNRNPHYRLLRRFYHRHEHFGPPVFFVGGVIWDAATLRRIDAWFDNLFLLGYLILLGVLLTIVALDQERRLQHPRLHVMREWFPPAIQFLAGALFNAYVIYYSQSASWATSFFMIVLIGLVIANEFIWERKPNLYVLFSIYFLACLTFFIFFLPVVTGTMGYATFLVSGMLSLGLVSGMLVYLKRRAVFHGFQLTITMVLLFILFGAVHLFYVENWIPPVPLALRAGGAYHEVQVTPKGYQLTREPAPWYQREFGETVFHRPPGDTVYCFAAVFAPTALETKVAHHWQVFNPEHDTWTTTDRITYEVTGGRRGGYRGYTFKRNVWPGRWRVDVETLDGNLIGRIQFRIAPVDTTRTPRLKHTLYE